MTEWGVAQVAGSFKGGGAQSAAAAIGDGLKERGFRSYLIALAERPDSCHSAITRFLGVDRHRPLDLLRKLFEFRCFVRRERIAVVHSHGPGSALFCAVALQGLPGLRLACTWHDSGEVLQRGILRRRILRWAVSRCSMIFGPSRDIVGRLRTATGARLRVSVLRNGVRRRPQSSGVGADEPVILWIARFRPLKAPEAVVRVAARLASEGLAFRVVMAGGAEPRFGWLLERVKAMVTESGLETLFSFPGWVDEVGSLLGCAGIGVQTSLTEGLSLSLLEQMMSGLAIVATDVGETASALAYGRAGILVPPGDEEGLTRSLRFLLQDRTSRVRLGRAARARALKEYSRESVVDDVADLYRRVMH